ncbi:MAG: hypothetical protein RLZZ214_2759 [Verrucomicrobiota bacterium]|jgi:hypothetical protein
MTMQPQPPPDVPSRGILRSRDNWIVSILLIIGLVSAMPFVLRQRVKAIQTRAIGNSRQLGLALFEFESDFGKFPDASTIAAVKAKSGSLLPLGTKTSNDYFRQLIAAGIAQSENFFYADIAGSRKPDGRTDGSHAIGKGECGYSYLSGLSSKDNPARAIVVTPLISGSDRFDHKRFDGKAVLLKLDNSVTSLPIQKDGQALVNGKNILDPTHPIWEGKPPVIAWPDL